MTSQQREVVRFFFRGAHYGSCMLDMSACQELVQFQKIVTRMAWVIWNRHCQESGRVNKIFKERTKLVIKRIEGDGTTVPLELIPDPDQRLIFQVDRLGFSTDPLELVKESTFLIYQAVAAANDEKPLPGDVPREVLSELVELGRTLPRGSEMHFALPDEQRVPISKRGRKHLRNLIERVEGPSLFL